MFEREKIITGSLLILLGIPTPIPSFASPSDSNAEIQKPQSMFGKKTETPETEAL